MKFTRTRIVIYMLLIGILSACGASPVSQPTGTVPPAIGSPSAHPATETGTPTEAAPATETAAPQSTTVSFAQDILPVIQSRCINCHGGNRTEEGLVMHTHADLMAGSDNGPVVIPGDAANSLFVELVANQEMPKRGPKLTPPQIRLFMDWVNQGAADN